MLKNNIFNEITKEAREMAINSLENMNTNTMKQLLKNLEDVLDADVFVYYGEIMNGIEGQTKSIIEDLSRDKDKHLKLYVVLTTPGGSLSPVQKMVSVFRKFYSEVNFIVPDYAYSAGTILCMSGDKIYMNYYSNLGPIDPQVQTKDGRLVSALGYLDKINDMLDKAKKEELTQAEFLILKDFDLAELRFYEQAQELAVDLLKKWLTKYKFKNWTQHSNGKPVTEKEKEERAVDIATKLSDNKVWKSHARPITMETLQNDLKVKIDDFDVNPDLAKALEEYNANMLEYISLHKYKCFFQSRLFI